MMPQTARVVRTPVPASGTPGAILLRLELTMTRLAIDSSGHAHPARHVRSPNCDARPDDTAISLVVVHGISLPPRSYGGGAIEALFTNQLDPGAHPYFREIAALRVSSHFLIRRDGELVQFVACTMRAWHAGVSSWRNRERCNDFSIGVELEGGDDVPYTSKQYRKLGSLLHAIAHQYPVEDVVGHSDVAPGRKTDPGPAFDWTRLRSALQTTTMRIGTTS